MLNSLGSTVQVNDPLVDPHLVPVPRLGSLTTGSLTGGDLQNLSWHTDRTFHLQLRVTGSTDQVVTYCTYKFNMYVYVSEQVCVCVCVCV